MGQGKDQGTKFPTRTCEGYDANDEAAWGGERRRATGAAHYQRCEARPRAVEEGGILYSAMRPQHLCTGSLPQLKPLRQQGRILLTHRGERNA